MSETARPALEAGWLKAECMQARREVAGWSSEMLRINGHQIAGPAIRGDVDADPKPESR